MTLIVVQHGGGSRSIKSEQKYRCNNFSLQTDLTQHVVGHLNTTWCDQRETGECRPTNIFGETQNSMSPDAVPRLLKKCCKIRPWHREAHSTPKDPVAKGRRGKRREGIPQTITYQYTTAFKQNQLQSIRKSRTDVHTAINYLLLYWQMASSGNF